VKVLVTGGGGFLGTAICKQLAARADDVVSFSRGQQSHLKSIGVRHIQGDIADADAVNKVCKNCDAVIHTAAKAGVWGSYRSFYQPNVVGTKNIVAACRHAGINRLVMTSSPSVVFDGTDIDGLNESIPYPEKFHAAYPETKALAEKAALAANSKTLAVTVLRPHLIWGPGDPHLVKRIVERGKSGKLKQIGPSGKRIDSVYIDNAAEAHRLALDCLSPEANCAGKAYFISNGEPVETWWLVNAILESAGVPPLQKTIPVSVAMTAATIMETVWKVFGIRSEPLLTRFVVSELSTSHWFDISAAQHDLGYQPKISVAEGLQKLKQSFQI
jgi:2-alkyl-3-oxoalkanoate reductase